MMTWQLRVQELSQTFFRGGGSFFMSRARNFDEYQHKGEKKINENAGFDFFSGRKMRIRKRNIMEE